MKAMEKEAFGNGLYRQRRSSNKYAHYFRLKNFDDKKEDASDGKFYEHVFVKNEMSPD